MKNYWSYKFNTGYDADMAFVAEYVAETCPAAVEKDLSSQGSNLREHLSPEDQGGRSPLSIEEALGEIIARQVCSATFNAWIRDQVTRARIPTLPPDLGNPVHIENGVRLWLRQTGDIKTK